MDFNLTFTVCLIILGVCLVLSGGSDVIGGWSDWTCQQDAGDGLCYIFRTCTPSPTFSCPTKHNEVIHTSCPCGPEWATWGSWVCRSGQNSCIQIRNRDCLNIYTIADCEKIGGESYEILPCDATCQITRSTSAAQTTSELMSPTTSELMSQTKTSNLTYPHTPYATQLATSGLSTTSNTVVSTVSPYIYWLEWTGWECENTPVCIMSRKRNCSTYRPVDCEDNIGGGHYQVEPCRKEICPDSSGGSDVGGWSDWTCQQDADFGLCFNVRKCTPSPSFSCPIKHEVSPTSCPCDPEWATWNPWVCHSYQNSCIQIRLRECSNNYTLTDCETNHGENSKHSEILPCDNITCHFTTSGQATTKVTSQTTSSNLTYPLTATLPASSGLLTTSSPSVAPEWATWNPWACPQHQIACVKVRFRECLHNYNKSDCEKIGGESYEIVPCDDTCK